MRVARRSPRLAWRLLVTAASIAASLGSAGMVAAHDAAVTGTPALTIEIGAGLDPATAKVAAGEIVEWINTDDERHRMRSTSGPARFDSGNLEPGESFRIRVVAGTYVYRDDRDRDRSAYHGRLVVSAGSGTASGGGSVSGGGEEAPAGLAHVTIADRAFAPGDIEVAVGGTVDWVNRDDRAHTVTSGDSTFSSANLDPGAAFSETFSTAGSFAYLCAIHPEMTGTVRVVAAAGAPADVVDPDAPAAALADPAATAVPDPAVAVPTTAPAPVASDLAAAPPAEVATDDGVTNAATSLAASDVEGIGRWLLVVVIVTAGVVLFARTIRGSVRSA